MAHASNGKIAYHSRLVRYRAVLAHRLRVYFRHTDPPKILLAGYAVYMLVGWLLLSLPFAQSVDLNPLDNLFIAVSAVSTTGLVSVDPGSSYSLFGEIVILALIQVGGLGYMTVASFVALAIRHRFSNYHATVSRAALPLPEHFDIRVFIRRVVTYTLIVEVAGAAALYALFIDAGTPAPLWAAIFHAVSAFCTAGFSLFPNSFESYAAHPGIVLTIAALSLLGAIGFIVMSETWDRVFGTRRPLSFTSRVILNVTITFTVVGTLVFFVIEPSIADMPPWERLLASFFQVMTAGTTVGFNTVPIGALAPATLVVMFFLMIFGASPSGTGGGLKSTTLGVLLGLIRSVLQRRASVRFLGHELPPERVAFAAASFAFYFLVLGVALFLLLLTEAAAFEAVLFEAISALGTVGLSMGLTPALTPLGKLVIVCLMFIGRLGVLTFGVAVVMRDASAAEAREGEIVL